MRTVIILRDAAGRYCAAYETSDGGVTPVSFPGTWRSCESDARADAVFARLRRERKVGR